MSTSQSHEDDNTTHGDTSHQALDVLGEISTSLQSEFEARRSLMSFAEWFELFEQNPRRHARNVVQYVRDMMDWFGTEETETSRGSIRRFKLFDMEFVSGREKLIGQEVVQNEFYQTLNNFVRERRPRRMVLLHGPNGSAKSSFINCLMRGLEHYSHLDEGALYRFNWIFPTEKISRQSIGFDFTRRDEDDKKHLRSYAHLGELEVNAKLIEELKDNPLFLVPLENRQEMLLEIFGEEARDPDAAEDGQFILSDYIFEGNLSHKSRLIFDALLASYNGDYGEVLKHVQVERFYISRRYRAGAVTVEPQLRVDAGSRQITADRSLSALPTSLQNQTLFEPHGELVDGNRGIIEFNDLLKRHPDLNKYLLATVEKGIVPVEHATLYIDALLIGSANEEFLEQFKGQPEYPSFKGRLELIRMPYILDYMVERRIYDQMLFETEVGLPVAPHTTLIAALWAVLTRLEKPEAAELPEMISEVVDDLSPLDKAELYATGKMPDGLTAEEARELRAAIEDMIEEGAQRPLHYEGRYGMSPRETKNLLLRAAQRPNYKCLSPLPVVDELRELIRDPSVHPFLRVKTDGDYHNNESFIDVILERYADIVDSEVRSCMGLVETTSYEAYFSRYVTTISHYLKNEKIYNRVTGEYEDPNEDFMKEVERTLGVAGNAREFRNDVISAVAAFRIDNPDSDIDYREIFPELFIALEESYFEERRSQVERIHNNLMHWIRGEADALNKQDREQVERTLTNMQERYGYCDVCAQEAISFLMKQRYE